MITRRKLLKSSAATGLLVASGGLAAPALSQGTKIRLGYVTPASGPLAAFAEADNFIIDSFLNVAGSDFEVIVKDSQSNPNRAAEVAKELIVDDEINLMLVASTPETTNPVTTTCEAEEIPVISTVAPWQPYFIGQQGNPGDPASWEPFNYGYHFFWGLEDIIQVFTNMWNQLDTNKSVGALYPNDGDGNAWGDPVVGFPPVLAEQGYTLTDTGRYQNLTDDFTAQINAFKQANCEIVTGVPIPPDFTTFWTQAKQQGFVPKAASIGKAILFPVSVEALGDAGHNLSSEVWWSPSHPFSSTLTGQTSSELADEYTASTGRQWTQPIGFIHALFELAQDVAGRVSEVDDGDAVAEAIAATDLSTIVGPIAWNGNGLPPFAAQNIAKTPLVGGQWRLADGGGYDLVVVDNQTAPMIATGGSMEEIS
ncbi:MAG: ABC transporter substrate-binding protein [Paracoccaceae bacterium]|nr:ABC transporter substrate-binding protein [Paracoccaceae bacterium]MDE2674762.1 ABC transporter substrate-binding protein [Paracoccaceae bacterium]MDE2738189.1 ABC transporter substrate-binding protein [Paracoccaceae bacterium]MXZ51077.1 ABC transporter substrate-binding protein [Paracoccaceae bacterium]MYF47183.1 ABC transporter substrate-binding protein [Paracoccaceae bacterium]